MAFNPTLASADPTALFISSANESVLSLVSLPRELSLYVASFLNLKDLSNVEATSKLHKNLVRNYCMNPVWKQLRDNRWAHGKLLWHAGPTFERSLDGVLVAVDNDLANWRDEVKRRVELDASLPERLARYAAATAEERRDTESTFKEDGDDIYDWLNMHKDDDCDTVSLCCALHFVSSGRIMELVSCLQLENQAAEGGDQHSAEFLRNQENHLRCQLVRISNARGDALARAGYICNQRVDALDTILAIFDV